MSHFNKYHEQQAPLPRCETGESITEYFVRAVETVGRTPPNVLRVLEFLDMVMETVTPESISATTADSLVTLRSFFGYWATDEELRYINSHHPKELRIFALGELQMRKNVALRAGFATDAQKQAALGITGKMMLLNKYSEVSISYHYQDMSLVVFARQNEIADTLMDYAQENNEAILATGGAAVISCHAMATKSAILCQSGIVCDGKNEMPVPDNSKEKYVTLEDAVAMCGEAHKED